MPFIPHTQADVDAMLERIGAASIDDLFDEIPAELRNIDLDKLPDGLSEMAVTRLMRERAARDGGALNFIGAGAYEHHVPAAVWEITTRGEFYSAYTPYQAEASQGTLQLIYEYQTMICGLTGMDVANASLYDGASGLAEAVLMAVRANRKSKSGRVLVADSLNPVYRQVTQGITANQDIRLESLGYDAASGITEMPEHGEDEDITAVVIPQPNFFGCLEAVDALTDWAHARGALVIAVVNPTALALIKPPGEWGSGDNAGADIVCGEGQPLGVPLASGGPYFGFMCCSSKHVRQMPGRIVGRTVDLDGQPGYTLTLQPREQHIRRSKATSNICTNQGLLVTAATLYMSLLGPTGLQEVAQACLSNTRSLTDALTDIPGVKRVFDAPVFHEICLSLPQPAGPVLAALAERGIAGGYAMCRAYPDRSDHEVLVCATETRTADDIDLFARELADILERTGSSSAVA